MADRAPDIFDTEPEGGSDEENVEEEYPEEEEDDDTDYDPWGPLCGNVGEDLKESFMAEVKRFLDKGDALHRKVMKTLHPFINEDDMDFDEAAESAVEKRKFLLNRVMTKKLVPNESDDEEGEEEVEASE
ncbi:hypothetical protein ACROYT_G035451 [Oculina patagonica]